VSLKSLQIVNAVETRLSWGYSNSECVGEQLMPRVQVAKRFGTYQLFGTEAFVVYDTKRGRGGQGKRIERSIQLEDYSIRHTHVLSEAIDDEEDEATIGNSQVNLITQSRLSIQSSLSLERETEIANLLTNVSTYGSNHGSVGADWKDKDASNPLDDILTAKQNMLKKIGKEPTHLALCPTTFRYLQLNQNLIEYYKFTTGVTAVGFLTEQMLATLFGVQKIVVGRAVSQDPATGTNGFIWGSTFAALLYVGTPQGTGVLDPSRIAPSMGYTLQVNGYSKVSQYRDEDRDSTIVKVKDCYLPLITCPTGDAGYFFDGITI
jgi:hypothetical protein